MEEECKHEDVKISSKGRKTCQDCFLVLDDLVEFQIEESTSSQIVPNGTVKLDSIISSLPIPEAVKTHTQRLFQERVKKNTKLSNRKAIIANCLMDAYRSLGKSTTTEKVQKLLGIEYKTISKGTKLCSSLYIGKKSASVDSYNPNNFVDNYLQNIYGDELENIDSCKIDLAKEKIDEYYDKLIMKSEIFNSSKVQSVSAGLLYYMIEKFFPEKYRQKKSHFAEKISVSPAVITKIVTEIERLM